MDAFDKQVVQLACMSFIASCAFMLVSVPTHEIGHSLLGQLQGHETLSMHVGFDTDAWVEDNYPDAIAFQFTLLGACIMGGGLSFTPDDVLAHQLYELWWIGFCSMSGFTMVLNARRWDELDALTLSE